MLIGTREPPLTLGIEEEYLLVDPETRDVAVDPPRALFETCKKRCGEQVSPEFLRAQIEIGTKVCSSIGEAREDLASLRTTVSEVVEAHGLKLYAASTHPFANWRTQKHTDGERYNNLDRDMRAAIRRLLICGMHVHIGIDDNDMRTDMMGQFCYFLPHLLALSCSSPFWAEENTGLHSYRLNVFGGMPRTGTPEHFASFGEYQRHVDTLVESGVLEDATKIWWDMRPSARYPTLEMRITDVCPRLDDAISIAAIAQCLMRALYRLRRDNKRWRVYNNMLVNENRWRAMRYGTTEQLVDFGIAELVSYAELFEEIIELIKEDAEVLGCWEQVAHARTIIKEGDSAHLQIQRYETLLAEGKDNREALCGVVDWVIEQTNKV